MAMLDFIRPFVYIKVQLLSLILSMILFQRNNLLAEIIVYKDNKKIMASGKNDEINGLIESLLIINTRLKEKKNILSDQNCMHLNNQCVVEITPILSNFFKKTFGRSPPEVYCYNAPLSFLGFTKPLTITTVNEFNSYISNCKMTTSPQPGDIGKVISKFHQDITTIHAFVYITKEMVYEKANSGDNPYHFISIKNSLKGYSEMEKVNGKWINRELDPRCLTVDPNITECKTAVVYYSCLPKYNNVTPSLQYYLHEFQNLNLNLKNNVCKEFSIMAL